MISVSPSSRKRKARDLNPHDPKVARFSRPARRAVSGYLPYSFHRVESRGIEPRFPPCHSGVFPLDHEPVVAVDLIGVEPITPILQRSVASIGMQALRFQEVRSGIEPDLHPYHGCVLPRTLTDHVVRVIPAGIEPALSCMSRRRLRRWTTGSYSQ